MVFRRAVLWLLLLALVAAQALGLMHRVVHVPGMSAAQAHAEQHAAARAHRVAVHDGAETGCGTGWIAALFAGHADDSTCRLFDPLNPESAPSVPVLVPAMVLASSFIDFFQGEFLARRAALYQARGPPPPR